MASDLDDLSDDELIKRIGAVDKKDAIRKLGGNPDDYEWPEDIDAQDRQWFPDAAGRGQDKLEKLSLSLKPRQQGPVSTMGPGTPTAGTLDPYEPRMEEFKPRFAGDVERMGAGVMRGARNLGRSGMELAAGAIPMVMGGALPGIAAQVLASGQLARPLEAARGLTYGPAADAGTAIGEKGFWEANRQDPLLLPKAVLPAMFIPQFRGAVASGARGLASLPGAAADAMAMRRMAPLEGFGRGSPRAPSSAGRVIPDAVAERISSNAGELERGLRLRQLESGAPRQPGKASRLMAEEQAMTERRRLQATNAEELESLKQQMKPIEEAPPFDEAATAGRARVESADRAQSFQDAQSAYDDLDHEQRLSRVNQEMAAERSFEDASRAAGDFASEEAAQQQAREHEQLLARVKMEMQQEGQQRQLPPPAIEVPPRGFDAPEVSRRARGRARAREQGITDREAAQREADLAQQFRRTRVGPRPEALEVPAQRIPEEPRSDLESLHDDEIQRRYIAAPEARDVGARRAIREEVMRRENLADEPPQRQQYEEPPRQQAPQPVDPQNSAREASQGISLADIFREAPRESEVRGQGPVEAPEPAPETVEEPQPVVEKTLGLKKKQPLAKRVMAMIGNAKVDADIVAALAGQKDTGMTPEELRGYVADVRKQTGISEPGPAGWKPRAGPPTMNDSGGQRPFVEAPAQTGAEGKARDRLDRVMREAYGTPGKKPADRR